MSEKGSIVSSASVEDDRVRQSFQEQETINWATLRRINSLENRIVQLEKDVLDLVPSN